MRRSRWFAVALLGATVVGTGLYVSESTAEADGVAPPLVTGCAIRFEAAGPAIYQNSTHLCTGATSVAVEPDGDLVIRSGTRGPVISMTVEEDETLVRRGILAGPSGGGSETVVRFFSTRTGEPVRADADVLKGTYSNIWVTWVNAG
ncbi:hypothetical protein EV193_104448 [Herbihabitans rhizosphaerae]|uniref:Uncharacterized protein n=1 Tax=Herbihabitans rhizosphaerae TaxID=1872711 RepID=A0A4Q7KUQ8_9PSEU|nr:hypothetical protein [Herbihabitans rhizosphaerae]RZS39232.1 hypothetical protein EV193_104448 [Herbihabitans rhizosphaerae]